MTFKKLHYLEKAKITSISSICFITEYCKTRISVLLWKLLKKTHLFLVPQMLSSMKRHLCLQSTKIQVFKLYYLLLLLPPIVLLAPIKTSKKYQDKVDKTEALKKEKEKNKMIRNEQKQVWCPSCGGTDHSRSSSNLCPMNKSKSQKQSFQSPSILSRKFL